MAKVYEYEWVFEPFHEEIGSEFKLMFGCKALYYMGKMVLLLAESDDPKWQGVCLTCDRENHEAILKEFPQLVNHVILPKWLYLPFAEPSFEDVIVKVQKYILNQDPRFGTIPKPKKKRAKTKVVKKVSKKKIKAKKTTSKKKRVKKKVTRKKRT